MDNVFIVSDDYSITLDIALRKRLGDPSVYHKNSFDSRELFLFLIKRDDKEYFVIHTSSHFDYSMGYGYCSSIKNGKIALYEGLLKPGQRLLWDGRICPSFPMWFEIL